MEMNLLAPKVSVFMKQLTCDSQLSALLIKGLLYYASVNIDGSEQGERVTANGIDLNRDQTLLSTPEARTLQRVALTVKPHLFIDFHEYKPLRASYEEVTDGLLVTNLTTYVFCGAATRMCLRHCVLL